MWRWLFGCCCCDKWHRSLQSSGCLMAMLGASKGRAVTQQTRPETADEGASLAGRVLGRVLWSHGNEVCVGCAAGEGGGGEGWKQPQLDMQEQHQGEQVKISEILSSHAMGTRQRHKGIRGWNNVLDRVSVWLASNQYNWLSMPAKLTQSLLWSLSSKPVLR